MEHARLSPSAAGRWVHCPGSVIMESQCPEQAPSESAREGTASHWVASEALLGRAIPVVGDVAPNGVVITDEMIAAARVYVDIIPTNNALKIEQKIHAPLIHLDCWGTPDLWYFDPDAHELHVWDYKYGHGIIEAFENWQGVCYAAGALDLVSDGLSDQSITVVIHIVQPRAYHILGSVREWRVAASEEFRGYVNKLAHAATEALLDNPRTVSGPHCRYCRARHICYAAQQAAMCSIDYEARASVQELPPDAMASELRTLQRAAKAIEYRLTGLEAMAIIIIQDGGHIPGYAIQSRNGRPTWTQSASEIFALGDMFGINLRKIPEPITPAQAKKAGIPADIVSSMSTNKSSGIKLVPTDKSLAAQVLKQKEL